VLVELDLRDPGWAKVLARARQDAGGQPLDVRLTSATPDQLNPAITALCELPILRLGVVDSKRHVTTQPLWERLRELTRVKPVNGLLIGGTRAHFTELNRTHHELPPDLEGITFSITPQMHDLSSEQLIESLTVQRQIALQAVDIAAGRPVHIGPVTLRARFNAVATSPYVPAGANIDNEGYGAELEWNSTDPRQKTDKYATWLLASAIALSIPGVESICFAEAWGPRGFGDIAGNAYPAAEVLSWLIAAQGAEVTPIPPEDIAPGLAVLVTRTDGQAVILAANTTDLRQELHILGLNLKLGPWAHLRLETSSDASFVVP
jgi:hypothetical protein